MEVEYEVRGGGVGVITLNAPERRNAFTVGMARSWRELVDRLEGEIEGADAESAPRALVLRGRGLSFCAGGDLSMLSDIAESERLEENARTLTSLYSSFLSIRRLGIPVVAALHGHCVGGGAGIAVGCADVRVCAKDTKLRFNFLRELGITPGMGTTKTLPDLLTKAHATKLLLQLPSQDVTPEELCHLGLVVKVAEDRDSAFEEALGVAAELARANPVATRSMIRTLRSSRDQLDRLEEVLMEEGRLQAQAFASPESRKVFKRIRSRMLQGVQPKSKL
ncbi:enoyl-CoA hydratase/isomerase [Chloropicon primus]|uniref:Enoyl-CoA hydratase/isomerase n=1 Tax=Chloropicon primus TaxID=1764295 RepID=A0A5B8MX55_9CHLO|nr:enoyl-CoA hydratase/isomerase [Chloropicon primus]UPR04296.1 enoyl-CoA hydratase/isomerase [Chloropicon primus]|eukprot:QDZ25087.1 enoyl-CoA hydratase/isomerase [Chloropicon primus]